mgnify:CR=1 FL=1
MADKTNKLTYIVEINDKGRVKIDNLTKGFVKADVAVKSLNTQLKKTTKEGLNPMIDKTGLAGATLVELGRTVSDLPYGFRGIANNLSQLSTLMTTLIMTTGGVKEGFQSLVKAFKGPLGYIVVFQAVIAAIDYLSASTKKSTEEVKKFSGAISSSLVELRNYLTTINDINVSQEQLNTLLEGAAASDQKLYDALEKSRLSQKEKNEITEEYLGLSNVILTVEKQIQEVRDEIQGKGRLYTKEDIDALEDRIALEEERLTSTFGIQKTQAQERINDLRIELEQARKNASEITTLELKLSELFKINAKYKRDQKEILGNLSPDKIDKFLSEEAFARLNGYFEEGILKLTKTREEASKAQIEIMKEGGLKALEELKRIGELRKEQEERSKESLKNGLAFIKEQAKEINDIFKATKQSFGYINDVVMSYHEVRMAALARERDYILHSGRLSEAQQRKAIADIEEREIKAQERKIKAERELFTIKQSLLIAEEIMNAKADLRANARKMGILLSQIGSEAAVQAGKAQMSIGAFAAEGGLKGLAAYAISIAGMLASIAAARRKAKAQLMSLGAPSAGGGGGGLGVDAPDFNVVGASPESQLAQSVSQQQTQPLRAFVVNKDIKDAEELDRTIDFNRSLG